MQLCEEKIQWFEKNNVMAVNLEKVSAKENCAKIKEIKTKQEMEMWEIYSAGIYDETGKRIGEQQCREIERELEQKNCVNDRAVLYGIVTENCEVRIFPIDKGWYEKDEIGIIDLLAHSILKVGDRVLIWEENRTGDWYFVQWEKGCGWVKGENIGITEKKIWLAWGKCTFALSIQSRQDVLIQWGMYQAYREVLMATKLPLKKEIGGVYWMIWPIRESNGELGFAQAQGMNDKWNRGYLPCTPQMIKVLGLAMLEEEYGWGGKGIKWDCTSLIGDIYGACGMKLPRNSKDMLEMPGVIRVEGGIGEKELEKLTLGSVLIFCGHGMLWLGRKGQRLEILHSVHKLAKISDEGKKEYALDCVCIGDLREYRCNGKTLLESVEGYWDIFACQSDVQGV